MFDVNVSNIERLHEAMENFQGNVEETINSVLHNDASQLIQESIRLRMPVSGKHWAGKRPPAKTSNSMRNTNENLTVWVRSAKSYQYLYFPDDGSNTRRHIGNQQFFRKGAEAVVDEIIDKCVGKLINNFEKGE